MSLRDQVTAEEMQRLYPDMSLEEAQEAAKWVWEDSLYGLELVRAAARYMAEGEESDG